MEEMTTMSSNIMQEIESKNRILDTLNSADEKVADEVRASGEDQLRTRNMISRERVGGDGRRINDDEYIQHVDHSKHETSLMIQDDKSSTKRIEENMGGEETSSSGGGGGTAGGGMTTFIPPSVRYSDIDDYEVTKWMAQSSFLSHFSDIAFDLFQLDNNGFDGVNLCHDHDDLDTIREGNNDDDAKYTNHTHEGNKNDHQGDIQQQQSANRSRILDKEFRKSSAKLLKRIVQYSLRPDAVTVISPTNRSHLEQSSRSHQPSTSSFSHARTSREGSPLDTRKDSSGRNSRNKGDLGEQSRLKQNVWLLSSQLQLLRAHTEQPFTALPIFGYVFIARWPASGALHFDFELQHSGICIYI